MKPEELKEVRRPTKHALPGEGAWMSAGANAPKLSKEFTDEVRRVSLTGDRKNSKDLAQMYEHEVGREKRKEEKKRASSLARRPSKEMLSSGELPPGLEGLHPDLAGTLSKEPSKESMGRRPSKDSKVSFVAADEADAQSKAEGERVPIARERRSIREVLKDNPLDNKGNRQFMANRNLDPERFKDRNFLDDIFLCYDPNGDGTGSLGYREFSKLVKDLGLKLNKKEVEGMMDQLDLNGNGLIEIEEFHFFFNHASSRDDIKAHAEDMCGSQNMFIRKLFEEFGDPDGRGLDFQGLQEMAKVCQLDKGENGLSNKELKQFFRRMDNGKTGFVSQEKIEFFFQNVTAREQLQEYMQTNSADNDLMLQQVFEKFDSSLQGGMNKLDLLAAAQFLGYKITEAGVQELLEKVDADNSGTVEVDEFINFFAQVRNTEELMEELENFKKAKEKKKYVLAAGWVLSITLCLCGAGLLYQDIDSVMNSYGYASLFIGFVIGSMLFAPAAAPAAYAAFVHHFITTCNPSKAIQCATLFFIGFAGLALYQMLNPNNPNNAIIDIALPLLLVPLVLGLIGAAVRAMFQSAGFLEAVSDSDDEKDTDAKNKSGSKKYTADLEKGNPGPPKKAF
jgi:Ca2+-binding EF-hand superfamily protein